MSSSWFDDDSNFAGLRFGGGGVVDRLGDNEPSSCRDLAVEQFLEESAVDTWPDVATAFIH